MDDLRDLAADVVEVDVDVDIRKRRGKIFVLVVDGDVVAVELLQVAHLLLAAGDSDRAATGELRELADDLADGTGGAGDDDRVARDRFADVEQAEVRREPGRADRVQREGRRLEGRRHATQRACPRERVLLPAELPDNEVAGGKPPIARCDDLADALGRHHLSDLQRRRVRTRVVHAPSLIRIDGSPQHPHEHFSLIRFTDIHDVERKIRLSGHTARS